MYKLHRIIVSLKRKEKLKTSTVHDREEIFFININRQKLTQ